MVRGKFRVTGIKEYSKYVNPTNPQGSYETGLVILDAQYDPKNVPEDVNFAKATPSARVEMRIDNPAALAEFTLGREFYVDFNPVELLPSEIKAGVGG